VKRRIVTLAWLVAALACYAAGLESGALVLFAAGIAFEIVFWARLLRRTGQRRDPGPH
jgi:hypothetical protein